MEILNKMVVYIINIIIVAIILMILTIIGVTKFQAYVEIAKNDEAFDTYTQDVCKDDIYKEDIQNKILTNEDFYGNEVIGYIAFPSQNAWASISQGNLSDGQLEAMRYGVAHDPHTPMPGEGGNVVIAGHRHQLFSNLQYMSDGDLIVININNNIFLYEIIGYDIVDPENDTEHAKEVIFSDDGEEKLTLYTCYPFEKWKYYDRRYVVEARPVASFELECSSGGING